MKQKNKHWDDDEEYFWEICRSKKNMFNYILIMSEGRLERFFLIFNKSIQFQYSSLKILKNSINL